MSDEKKLPTPAETQAVLADQLADMATTNRVRGVAEVLFLQAMRNAVARGFDMPGAAHFAASVAVDAAHVFETALATYPKERAQRVAREFVAYRESEWPRAPEPVIPPSSARDMLEVPLPVDRNEDV